MRDYLAFAYSHIAVAGADAHGEGVALAADCLQQLSALNNPKRFPPRLLILFTSPEYLDSDKVGPLLAGIRETFIAEGPGHEAMPLIGCSVVAVFCGQSVYEKGALLICLASSLMSARIAAGENARRDPEGAIKRLLTGLALAPDEVDPNPLGDRLLLTFLPGFKVQENEEFYPAPRLHRLLRDGVQARIGLAGGVCSVGNYRHAEGWLYAGGEQYQAYKDAVVAANISAGVPIGAGLSYGFEKTGNVLQVREVADDQRTVLAFDKCSPAELIEQEGRRIFLIKLSTDGDPIIDLPLPTGDARSLQLLRRVQPGDYFQVAKPDAGKILEQFKEGFTQARKRILIKKPVACLTIFSSPWCNTFRKHVDIKQVMEYVEREGVQCVGGLFDGEMGIDKTGRSLFMNGASSYLVFGDEMRERAPLYQSVEGLAKFGGLLNDSDRVIEGALKIVLRAGFPGAMLSLVMPNRGGDFIVAQQAIGTRFEKIVEMTRSPVRRNDILAMVIRGRRPQFIADSRKHRYCNREAVRVSQIISQYILPLKRLDGSVFGVLQVDLGDLSYLTEAQFTKTEKARTLNSLAEIFQAGLNRVIGFKETEISAVLDEALSHSLSAASVEEGLQRFIEIAGSAFGVEVAHVRFATPEGMRAIPTGSPVLTLVAGLGPLYEISKRNRREVSARDSSLIYPAFRNGKVNIVNDVSKDYRYRNLCRLVADNAELTAALAQIKSYAAVAFKNEEGEKLGALSLASTKPWYFTDYLERALLSLAQRTAFLIEHLRAKIRLEFLFNISTKLDEIDLDEMPRELEVALNRFSKAIRAEVSALYLWDEDRKKFVLRAQYQWQAPEWVNGANYKLEDNWIGVKALQGKSLYIPDLYRFYKSKPYKPGGRYAPYMFGQPLSDTYTVEALALPLEIGKRKQRFGILTLYRRIKPDDGSGFLSMDTKMLEEGANKMAGLVNALVEHRQDFWRLQEQDRQQAVYAAIDRFVHQIDFEAKTCEQVLEAYRAIEAHFYKASKPDAASLFWMAGYRRHPATNSLEELPEAEPDEMIKQAVASALGEKKEDKVVVRRVELKDEEWHDPRAVATEGLVARACIPLTSAEIFVGVLDLRWQITHRQADALDIQHHTVRLQQLGPMIGSVYRRHQFAREAEQSRLAVQATGAYVSQRAHRLLNAIQNLYRRAQIITKARTEQERQDGIRELMDQASEYVDTINWTFDLGEGALMPARESLPVYDLIKESLDTIDSPKDRKKEIQLYAADHLAVRGSPELIKEIFVNLINNAFKAMEVKGTDEPPVLKISAALCDDRKQVKIVFEDNGVGMTDKEIKNAQRGFARNGSHKSTGVLLSTVLTQVQRGSLTYESQKGKGTKAVVTLPRG